MAKRPLRTWTLGPGGGVLNAVVWNDDGPVVQEDERVEVVEKAPVDAERKRMLNLLEVAEKELSTRTTTHARIYALLGEHDRLIKR